MTRFPLNHISPKVFGGGILLLLLLGTGAFFGYRYWNFLHLAPTVVAGNFNLEYKKIPYNAPYIDITFSHPLDPKSVTSGNVVIYPFVPGTPSLEQGNVIRYTLGQHLEIGKKYLVELKDGITSDRGTKLESSVTYEIEAIAGVTVTKMIPSEKTDALGKNPIFIFNIPVVSLSSLKEKDTLPCPVKFTPDISGTCTWLSGNILEYTIQAPLNASTEYSVHIDWGGALLFPLEKAFDGKFRTTELSVLTGSLDESGAQRFSPKEGIPLRFTAPVSPAELEKFLSLTDEAGKAVSFKILSTEKNPGDAGSSFRITGSEGAPLEYSKKYLVSIREGLPPSPGNIVLAQKVQFPAQSNAFISQVSLIQLQKSATGALEDTIDLTGLGFLPPKNARIVLTFDEDVDLEALQKNGAQEAIYLQEQGKEKIACILTQPKQSVPEAPDSLKMVDRPNLRMVFCEPKESLVRNTPYDLVIEPRISSGLRTEIRKPVPTPPKFSIQTFDILSATEACVYSTTPIPYTSTGFVFTPAAKMRGIGDAYYDYEKKKEVCPPRPGLRAQVAQIRLDGNTQYELKIPASIQDIYGEPLETDFVKTKFQTPALTQKDEYLYFIPGKEIQTLPLSAPVVLPIQSVNVSDAYVRVCSLSPQSYAKYTSGVRYTSGYTPDCESEVTKRIALKNGKWNLTTQKIDISADVLGGAPLPGNILLIRVSVDPIRATDFTWYQERAFTVTYVRTNLSLALESAENKNILLATTFDGVPVPDLRFEMPGCSLALPKWNATKQYYEFAGPWWSGCTAGMGDVLIARSDTYYGVLASSTDATSNYDFGQMGGMDSMEREYVYLHTDRPIYRAGDTIHFQGILRTFATTAYVNSRAKKVKLRILTTEGQLFKEIIVPVDGKSNFSGTLDLVQGMRTGRYSFEVVAYNDSAAKETDGYYVVNDASFFVEQYVKPVFRTEVTSGKREVQPWDTQNVEVQANYYFGWSVPRAKVHVSVREQDYYFDPKQYSEFRFGVDSNLLECRYWGVCASNDRYIGMFDTLLDESGKYRFSHTFTLDEWQHDISDAEAIPRERIVTFTAEVADPNTGKTVSNSSSNIVHTTDGYVWIQSPYWIETNGKIPTTGVVLNTDSSIKAGAPVKLELVRAQWNSVKKLGVDGMYYNEYELQKTIEQTKEISSSQDGRFRFEFTPASGGEYIVRATYTGANKRTYVSETYSYVSTAEHSVWNTDNNSITEFIAEKSILQPGETAQFTLKSSTKKGKILLLIEKDNQILDSWTTDITGYAQKIEVPIQKMHIPNIYIKAFLIGRDDANALPVFKRGLAAVRVLPDSQNLQVQVRTPKTLYIPGENLTIDVQVKDSEGKPVSGAVGTLAVVDESVLALVGNPTKNPFAFFYDMKRYLGTTLYVSLVNLVDKLEVKNTVNGEKWGAGEGNKGWDTKKKRGVFKDTAFWTSEFVTDAQWNATISAGNLPDNLTTWSIEAVLSTAKTQVWAGRLSITTAQRVMVQDTFPRFIRTGDRMEIAPVIFNRTGKRTEFSIELTASGAEVSGGTRSITLDDGVSQPVSFWVSIPAENSLHQIQFMVRATAKTGEQDILEKIVPVQKNESYETTSIIGSTEGNSPDQLIHLPQSRKDGGFLTVRVSPSLLGNATSGIETLLRYPYGCIEQITSAVIPHIAVKHMYDVLGLPYDIKEKTISSVRDGKEVQQTIHAMLTDYVARVARYQILNGGFAYWSGGEYADFEMTAYAMEALADVKGLGVSIDSTLSQRALWYLKERLARWVRENCRGSERECAYTSMQKMRAIAAIAAWSQDGVDALKLLRAQGTGSGSLGEVMALLHAEERIFQNPRLSAEEKDAVKRSAKSRIDWILSNRLVLDPRGAYVAAHGEVSRIEATAQLLQAISLFGGGDSSIGDNLTRFLADQKKSDSGYGSTKETAAVLRAFTSQVSQDEKLQKVHFQAKGILGTDVLFERTFDRGQILEQSSYVRPLRDLPASLGLSFSKNGEGRLYFDATLQMPIPSEEIQARDAGFFIQTQRYDFAEYQKIQEQKTQEFEEYQKGNIRYRDLRYPKSVSEYLKPIAQWAVGQLIQVEYRLILSETRDRVAFESPIPSGTELVNTALATETNRVSNTSPFEREDIMDDRFFAYSEVMDPGEYVGTYTVRVTQAGNFGIPPSRAFEFYTPEVFGQTWGGSFTAFSGRK